MQTSIHHLSPALQDAAGKLAASTVTMGDRVPTLRVPNTPLSVVLALAAACLAYGVGLALYRLCFSPLARFPGPKLAAAFEWYEFYYLVAKGGQWGNRVNEMHQKYGPIVRTGPWELSIRDPSFYSQLYVTSSVRRTNMWARGREGNGFDHSHHLSVPHDLHRMRRKHLEGFFSRHSITNMEPFIAAQAEKLDRRLKSLSGTGHIVHIDHALTAMTGDIICRVSCGMEAGLLDDPLFSPGWNELMLKTVVIAPVFRCFTWLNRLIQMMPESVLHSVYPKGISNMMLGKTGRSYIEEIKRDLETNKHGSGRSKNDPATSVFHHLLASAIPDEEKSTSRLQAESMVFLLAGTLAGAHTLTFVVYYVLADEEIQTRLRHELSAVMKPDLPNLPTRTQLERLPYLRGCVKEALRLNGLVGNLARCSPDEVIHYKQWAIPKNTPVGMSIFHMHTNSSVFPDPYSFRPERWLGHYDPRMDQNFVPFTKGSRNCLGMNLAWAELYIATAMLFRPGGPELRLHDTKESDIKIVCDYIMGFPDAGSKGVRVEVM